ncbi:hypothetical protein [Kitasatospora phosalacinea]|uniref:hypothetical protein n=1 Tax=Kitasatospora phosalacinea TaxID=2065 RepID=UPI0025533F3B|nr:hypothetical protein [Kitasatospora phosalacinea]
MRCSPLRSGPVRWTELALAVLDPGEDGAREGALHGDPARGRYRLGQVEFLRYVDVPVGPESDRPHLPLPLVRPGKGRQLAQLR